MNSKAMVVVLALAFATSLHAQPAPANRWSLIQGGDGAGLYVDLASLRTSGQIITADFLDVPFASFSAGGKTVDARANSLEINCQASTMRLLRTVGFNTSGELTLEGEIPASAGRPKKFDGAVEGSVCLAIPVGAEPRSVREAVSHARSKADTTAALKELVLPDGPLLMIGGNRGMTTFLIQDRTSNSGDGADVWIFRVYSPAMVTPSGKAIVQSVSHARLECVKRAITVLNEANFDEGGGLQLYMPRTAPEPVTTSNGHGIVAGVVCDRTAVPAANLVTGHRAAVEAARRAPHARR